MIRIENMISRAFLIGIIKMVDKNGVQNALEWLREIGEELAEIEGPGFEGAREDDINYLPVCPFSNTLLDFIAIYGERPSQFVELVNLSNKQMREAEDGWEYPALTTVTGILHHSYIKRRGKLAGVELLNVGSRCPRTNNIVYNEKALEKANMTKEDVDKYLEKAYYVCKINYLKKE
ncbi:hypothetical protein J7W08_05540 [Methanococcoides orientis]|uniref:hypothetical protein n=1 Tax=Methanococcoides orientis TaxID=2822137 RepID=UPI001E60B1D3|nr:hypothetical protein [Methanococcoides orientis]UGV41739.1 hypothetical protein J7W08_05540 [Methanococcoides orientis]